MTSKVENIAVIGASGAIGSEFCRQLALKYPAAQITAFSRNGLNTINYDSEESIAQAAELSTQIKPLDLVVVAVGMLHDETIMPEKSLKDLSADKFHALYQANAVIPALLAKYFVPKLNKDKNSVFSVLSARVGSISDNKLGGWYAYRASKAALNMIIKNIAVETNRQNEQAIIVGLHPGTVDSGLSKPFQANVPEGKLFTPEYAVQQLLSVICRLTPENTGRCYAWDGNEIHP